MNGQTEILNGTQIAQKVKRIAWQINETFYQESEIIIAGITDRGLDLAERLLRELQSISDIKGKLCAVTINKKNPLETPVEVSIAAKDFSGKNIVLVDDVLNSGKTLIYGAKYFLDAPVKKLTTAVLVDRNHNRYPIKADFVGLSLSTTLQEHVTVDLAKNTVFLS
ncbi:MAG: pyrimidine operon attenuation protein/uracil phosphoribosyltransferase [Candidatus Azotimanducaceae bacterium]|jgi:pyrimidine operon attenuation protein/uracil phosphoribosyltransferase